MQGLELAEQFFREYGLPFFEKRFPELMPRLAFGLAGHGSECFGFDDEISQDHDFTCGFAVWISDEDEEKYGFELARAYSGLIREHFIKSPGKSSKLGESEHGICRISSFYERHIGIPASPQTWRQWLDIPESAFAEAVNGRVFMDNAGEFSRIRKSILNDLPEDVRLKKLAARLLSMAQYGQYNYMRCFRHGEPGAAGIALAHFVSSCISAVFLLNRAWCPYYKWMFRAVKALPVLGELGEPLEFLLDDHSAPEEKAGMIEDISAQITAVLRAQELSDRSDNYLEPHAFELMKKIRSAEIRALHVLEG